MIEVNGKGGLFERLAKSNTKLMWKTGISEWISTDLFVGEFKGLVLGNGGSYIRKDSGLDTKYYIETQRDGTKITAIKLNGYRLEETKKAKGIHPSIRDKIKRQRDAFNGTKTGIEVDHNNGQKNNPRVNNLRTQLITDFQALSKHNNDVKRQACKECVRTGVRPNPKDFGYPFLDIYEDGLRREPDGCDNCIFNDVKGFKSNCYVIPSSDKQIARDPEYAKLFEKEAIAFLKLIGKM